MLGNNKFRDTEKLPESNKTKTQKFSAKAGFQAAGMKMWKSHDYRCLKPKKGVSSEKWPHYEMNGYRAARNQRELDKVKEIKFDKNFYNLEDPKVWKAMKDPKKGPKLWKKTYGFDYVSLIEGQHGKANNTKCYINCFRAEHTKFAKDCKDNGGVFKCCMIRYIAKLCSIHYYTSLHYTPP